MKNRISNINAAILTKDSLKKIKGGLLQGCGECIDNDGNVLGCNGTPETGCCCNSGNDNNKCG